MRFAWQPIPCTRRRKAPWSRRWLTPRVLGFSRSDRLGHAGGFHHLLGPSGCRAVYFGEVGDGPAELLADLPPARPIGYFVSPRQLIHGSQRIGAQSAAV